MAFGIIRRIANATQALAGLMSAADKTKLDGIEAGATATAQPQDNLTSESTTAPLSANQGRILKGLIDGDGIVTQNINATGLTIYAVKYGRVCTLFANAGTLSTAVAEGNVIVTLPAAFRPTNWVPIADFAQGVSGVMTNGVYYAINSSGAITANKDLASGTYCRFCATYITLT